MIPIAILALLLASSAADARDRQQVRQFRKANPCPATGKVHGPCPGWVVDHVTPLCAYGIDAPVNMQWQTRADSLIKDIEERRTCRQLRQQ